MKESSEQGQDYFLIDEAYKVVSSLDALNMEYSLFNAYNTQSSAYRAEERKKEIKRSLIQNEEVLQNAISSVQYQYPQIRIQAYIDLIQKQDSKTVLFDDEKSLLHIGETEQTKRTQMLHKLRAKSKTNQDIVLPEKYKIPEVDLSNIDMLVLLRHRLRFTNTRTNFSPDRLLSYTLGLPSTHQLRKYVAGETEPKPVEEQRLRNSFFASDYIVQGLGSEQYVSTLFLAQDHESESQPMLAEAIRRDDPYLSRRLINLVQVFANS